MADVISIEEKIKISEEKKAELLRRQKIEAVRKATQCLHCALRCEKCGSHMDADKRPGKKCSHQYHRVPYRFCDTCREDYIDYIDRLRGGGDQDRYWHNDAWMEAWRTWIDYHASLDRYIRSHEFKKLMKELSTTGPE